MKVETSPFQVNLAYQVPRKKTAENVGKAELERQRAMIDGGGYPFQLKLIGLKLGGQPITDYAPDLALSFSSGSPCADSCRRRSSTSQKPSC